MTLKEIAAAFNMTVTEFCKVTGYTRQAFYNKINGSHVLCATRMLATVNLLTFMSEKIMKDDIEKAKENRIKRNLAIEYLTNLKGM